MKTIGKKLYQRTSNVALAFILTVSSLSTVAPTFFSQVAHADTTSSSIVTTAATPNGWSSTGATGAETRNGSTVSYVTDATEHTLGNGALHITTSADTTTKAQFMKLGNSLPLASITGSLGYSTKQNSASFVGGDASYQIQVYLNPDGANTNSGYATLGYEPYVNAGTDAIHQGVWQNWSMSDTTGQFYSSKTIVGNNGGVSASQGSSTYTLGQIKTMFPHAVVIAYGLNVGGNNPNYDVEVDNFTFNGTAYNFEPVLISTPTNLAPTTNTYTNNVNFNNTWSAVSGAVAYEYQTSNVLANSSTLGSIIYHDSSDLNANNYDLTSSTVVVRHNNQTPQGTYYWQVRAIDSNGVGSNWSSIRKVTVDTTAPAPQIVSSALVSGVTPIKVQTNDTNINYSYIEINKNGAWKAATTVNGANPVWNFDTTTLPDGLYTIKVDSVDLAGNGKEVTYNFTIDNHAPILHPNITNGTVSGTQTITLLIDEPHLKASNIRILDMQGAIVSVNGVNQGAYNGVGTGNPLTYTWNTKTIPDGTYKISYSAIDTTDHSASALYSVVVDNTPPALTINSPTQQTISGTTSSLTDRITITDAAGRLVGTATVEPTQNANGSFNWTFTLPTQITAASTTFSVTSVDTANNPATQQVTITTPAPDLTQPPAGGPKVPQGAAPKTAPATPSTATGTADTDTTDAAVLGETTTTPNSAPATQDTGSSDNPAAILGDATTKNTGIAWYWWIIIAAAVIAILWCIIAAARRHGQEKV